MKCEKKIFLVPDEIEHIRVDKWLSDMLDSLSRSQIKKLILDNKVLLNLAPCSVKHILTGGEEITVLISYDLDKLVAVEMDLDIVHEDADIIVINKPVGIVVHPGAGTKDTATLVQGVLAHCEKLSSVESDPMRPGVVHRLDKDTSGLIVFAKNDYAHKKLKDQFADKSISREYYALLDGCLEQEQKIVEGYIARDQGYRTKFWGVSVDDYQKNHQDDKRAFRYAKSFFTCEKTYADRFTLARVSLFSGRTHQIRVHAAQILLPVVGDSLYNHKRMLPQVFAEPVHKAMDNLKRQMLHAHRLEFVHPTSKESVAFTCSLPQDFSHLLELLEDYCN
jgi:23S rRNA pseudouridine1911/1915/1917 synthase